MLNLKEITFILESLEWAKKEYMDKANKYLHDESLPYYYQDMYKPKLNEFDEVKCKLRNTLMAWQRHLNPRAVCIAKNILEEIK